jgi:hypothetical protein
MAVNLRLLRARGLLGAAAPAGGPMKMKRSKVVTGVLAFAVLVSARRARRCRPEPGPGGSARSPALIPGPGGWQASLVAANLLWIRKVAVERRLEEARRKSNEATAQLKVIKDMLESSQTQQEAEHMQVQALTSALKSWKKVSHRIIDRHVMTPLTSYLLY